MSFWNQKIDDRGTGFLNLEIIAKYKQERRSLISPKVANNRC